MSEGAEEYYCKIGERIKRNQARFHDLRFYNKRSKISPLRSIVFVTGPKARTFEVTIHNLTIPPTQLSKVASSFTTFAIGLYGTALSPSLVRTFIPGEDLLLAAGGLI